MNDLNEWLDCWRPIRAGFEQWSLQHGSVAICYLPSDGSLNSYKRFFDLRPDNPARLGLISAQQLGSITWCLLHEGMARAAQGIVVGDTDIETEVSIANRTCEAFKRHAEHAGNLLLEAPAQLDLITPEEWRGYRGLKLWIAALFGEADQPGFRTITVPGLPSWSDYRTYPHELKRLRENPFAASVLFIDRLRALTVAESVHIAANSDLAASTTTTLPQVNLKTNQVRYDGQCYDVSSDGALLLSKLVESHPHAITASKYFSKPSDVKNRLPPLLRKLIATESGKGYWLSVR